ncbi:helix-turn-helix domain-containing protein [Phototrophicus methaneseepsis]|uniref:Helix-turn-helix domain-containing protein n=1 Tax=Phototrophicus methaneseepsis TaxID=2710758 RepID=A0A7S8E623_9CHLR|nr:helix-turn-helix domain-containing protein [Phototrophicus methaneseepsis]QPC81037.1 helix-turn-helix domain-containing protein [Phototrophicus methaneseepsis]
MTATQYTEKRRALAGLSGNAYKVLDYLCILADERGVAWPKQDDISDGVALAENTVRERLDELVEAGYVRYLRKDSRDELTRRKEGNVYILNPSLLLTTSEEGSQLWNGANPSLKNCGRQEQLQEHLQEQVQELPTDSQHHYFGCFIDVSDLGRVGGSDSDVSESSDTGCDDLPLFQYERELMAGSDLFRDLVQSAETADRPRDGLADRLAYWQIGASVTRRWVEQYGIDLVEQAYAHVKRSENVKNPAALMGWSLKNPQHIRRVTVPVADVLMDGSRYASGQYADFILS